MAVPATPMSIEWYRDLSITLLGFVATAGLLLLGLASVVVLIFVAIFFRRLYRTANSVLSLIEAASQIEQGAGIARQGAAALIAVLALIQGLRQGFQGSAKKPRRETNQDGKDG